MCELMAASSRGGEFDSLVSIELDCSAEEGAFYSGLNMKFSADFHGYFWMFAK